MKTKTNLWWEKNKKWERNIKKEREMSQKEKSDNYWFRIKKQILEFLFAVMNRTKFKKILFLKLV